MLNESFKFFWLAVYKILHSKNPLNNNFETHSNLSINLYPAKLKNQSQSQYQIEKKGNLAEVLSINISLLTVAKEDKFEA